MFQHLITTDVFSDGRRVSPGMSVIILIIVTLFLLLSYFWIDFFYVLFYKTMGLKEDSLLDTFAIALSFTLIVIMVIFTADECVDWNEGSVQDPVVQSSLDLQSRLDELITVLKG